MRKSLYIKFVISYLILAFIGFFAVSMFGSSMVHNHLDSVYSTSLYQEATNIAQNQASKYYREQASLESVAQNLETLSKYQNVEIWLISKKGEILLNTASDSDENVLNASGLQPLKTVTQKLAPSFSAIHMPRTSRVPSVRTPIPR